MTEAEWLACGEPDPMLDLCKGRERKLRLFACACARLCAGDEAEGWHAQSLDLNERFADGEATEEECLQRLDEIEADLNPYSSTYFHFAVAETLGSTAAAAAHATSRTVATALERRFVPPDLPWHLRDSRKDPKPHIPEEVKRAAHRTIDHALAVGNKTARGLLAGVLREIFGNPFRPAEFDATWRTSDVMLLAAGIYAEKAFDRMPILADALQDAGCNRDDLLTHLRDTNTTHVRGCWALDLVLGKE